VTGKQQEHSKRYSDNLRLRVFTRLCGGTPHCMCLGCTVTEIDFLVCDHVRGNGKEHRASCNLGTGAARLWRQVEREGYPEGEYQVLCCNCNHSKGRRASCKLSGQSHVGESQRLPIVKFDPALATVEA
jgi:hypothetical protein